MPLIILLAIPLLYLNSVVIIASIVPCSYIQVTKRSYEQQWAARYIT